MFNDTAIEVGTLRVMHFYILIQPEHDGKRWTDGDLRSLTGVSSLPVSGNGFWPFPAFIEKIVLPMRAHSDASTNLICLGPISDDDFFTVHSRFFDISALYGITEHDEQLVVEVLDEFYRLSTNFQAYAVKLRRIDNLLKQSKVWVRQMAADWPSLVDSLDDLSSQLELTRQQQEATLLSDVKPLLDEFRANIQRLAPIVIDAVRQDSWLNSLDVAQMERSLVRVHLPGSVSHLFHY